MLRRLDHVAFIVEDLAASRRFYGDALGLPEVARPDSFRFAGAWYGAGEDTIHLIVKADTTQAEQPPEPGAGLARGFATHAAFEVDDLDELIARMAAHGEAIAAGPLQRGDGVRQAYFRDPDGHVLELYETTAEDQAGAVRLPMQQSA